MAEISFTCWYQGQKESDGKLVKAPTVQEAARIAADIWRHDHLQEFSGQALKIFVKDEQGQVAEVEVRDPSSSQEASI